MVPLVKMAIQAMPNYLQAIMETMEISNSLLSTLPALSSMRKSTMSK